MSGYSLKFYKEQPKCSKENITRGCAALQESCLLHNTRRFKIGGIMEGVFFALLKESKMSNEQAPEKNIELDLLREFTRNCSGPPSEVLEARIKTLEEAFRSRFISSNGDVRGRIGKALYRAGKLEHPDDRLTFTMTLQKSAEGDFLSNWVFNIEDVKKASSGARESLETFKYVLNPNMAIWDERPEACDFTNELTDYHSSFKDHIKKLEDALEVLRTPGVVL
jgi:hypothetical protein